MDELRLDPGVRRFELHLLDRLDKDDAGHRTTLHGREDVGEVDDEAGCTPPSSRRGAG